MDKILEGKKAIVTGGTAGIGRAIVLKFAQAGAKVAVIGTSEERGRKVCEEVRQITGNELAKFYRVDVANTQEVDTACKEIITDLDGLDILVNNAGITRDGLLLKMTEEDWDQVMNVNVKSCYNTCKAVLRTMTKARKGTIINMSSIVGKHGNAGQTNYAASKAAIMGFTKALAKEVGSRNITVNCIAPGFTDSPMTESLTEKQREEIFFDMSIKRMAKPEEIAELALYLAGPNATFITGQTLSIDGGKSM